MNTLHPQSDLLHRMMERGVIIPCPSTVAIGTDVDPERIEPGVTIHAGCKIYGPQTLIQSGAVLGYEAPATVNNCQLGRDVLLKGGFFSEACFLSGASMGSGAQVRDVCLLEEGAKGAHSVGIKQTILFPFVTLGSLINFCDCLMAGGTDPSNHSEVGSSYIHFNYTPNQDKATASLIGDVPRGVMLNSPPIFLGGQGGMVGPVRIGYGTVVAAGTILRKDLLEENTILMGHRAVAKKTSFQRGFYPHIKRIIKLNSLYIANLIALRQWYLDIRSQFFTDPTDSLLLKGGLDKLDRAVEERLKRFGEVADRMASSIQFAEQSRATRSARSLAARSRQFRDRWPRMEDAFRTSLDRGIEPEKRDLFLELLDRALKEKSKDYIDTITNLTETDARVGSQWLQAIVDRTMSQISELLPDLEISGD